jgi:hypothetical protein
LSPEFSLHHILLHVLSVYVLIDWLYRTSS